MCELRSKHVEGNRAFDGLVVSHEIKARSFVDELRDQPGLRESIDMHVLARDPAAILKACHGQQV